MQKMILIVLSGMSVLFAGGGVDVHVSLGMPVPEIEFNEPPRVVVAAPGIYVIPDYPEEVFFVSGSYWVVRDNHWFRCHGAHHKWIMVRNNRVPHILIRTPRGRYRNWHPRRHEERNDYDDREHHDHGHGRGHDH